MGVYFKSFDKENFDQAQDHSRMCKPLSIDRGVVSLVLAASFDLTNQITKKRVPLHSSINIHWCKLGFLSCLIMLFHVEISLLKILGP